MAIVRLRDDLPDLTTLDRMLPGLSDIEKLRHLHSVAASPTPPVLMLTGRIDAADRSRALQTGANAFPTKPLSMLELMAMICVLIAGPCEADTVAATGEPVQSQ